MKVQVKSDFNIGFKTHTGAPSPALPKQQDALNLFGAKKHTLAAGGLGTGKTDALAFVIAHEAMRYPGNLILTGRNDVGSFITSTLTNILDMIPPVLIKRHNQQRHVLELINNSKIVYPPLDESQDAIKKVKSMNLGLVAIDQLEQVSEGVFKAARGQLRRKKSSRKSFSTCNPAGKDWVHDLFVTGGNPKYGFAESHTWREGVPAPTCQEDVTPAVTDNIHLSWDYIADLLDNPSKWVKRYVYCAWSDFEGLVWHMAKEDRHKIKPFMIPRWWNRYRVLDHGHRNPTAVLWAAMSPPGFLGKNSVLFFYKAHYEADRWVDYHAAVIHARSKGEVYQMDMADPTIFHERDSSATIARQYADLGLYWQLADNDKKGGIDRAARWWQNMWIRVFDLPEFEPFWEEIERYHWKDFTARGRENHPEEVVKKNDHFCDDVIYIVNHVYASKDQGDAYDREPDDYRDQTIRSELGERAYMAL